MPNPASNTGKTSCADVSVEGFAGRWYLNIVVEIPEQTGAGSGQVGIDLGLKETAACSNGEKLHRGGF